MSARRRQWLAIAIVALLAFGAFRLLDQPLALESYRLVDPEILEVVGYGTPNAWTHVTGVTETESTVTVSANSFTFQLGPGTAAAYRIEIQVPLSALLGTRTVIDGSTGQPVPEGD